MGHYRPPIKWNAYGKHQRRRLLPLRRFAQLRAAYPNMDAADIFECIHDEEVNDAIAAHERSLDAIDSNRCGVPRAALSPAGATPETTAATGTVLPLWCDLAIMQNNTRRVYHNTFAFGQYIPR